jgi:hypothetical protein
MQTSEVQKLIAAYYTIYFTINLKFLKIDLKILAYQWLLFGTGFLVEMGGLREVGPY